MFRKAIIALWATLALGVSGSMAAEVATISLRDGLVWADVACNGTTLHFVVDTGAVSSCVNLAAAKRAGLRLGEAVNVAGVGGRAIGYRCTGFQASVGGMRLPGEVLALDLSGPARACSRPIDGLIGTDFFKGSVVRIDYAHGELIRGAAPAGEAIVPLRFAQGVICVPVAVDGMRSRWTRLDTGCTDALIWCAGISGRAKSASRSVALASASHGTMPADVVVGGMATYDMPVQWCNREIFPGEAGLLGNAALCRYRAITIDGIRKRLEVSL